MSDQLSVVIVGAGLAGMANYLFLRKLLPASLDCSITILEAYSEPQRSGKDASSDTTQPKSAPVGGGLGIAPNGLRQLSAISPGLLEKVNHEGYPVRNFQMNSARGFTLGDFSTEYNGDLTLMIQRQAIWDALRGEIPDEAFQWNQRVTSINEAANGQIEVILSDKQSISADIVIGADGLKSSVRGFVLDDQCKPTYEGLLSIGGRISTEFLPPLPEKGWESPNSPVVMTFGSDGFVGYAPFTRDNSDAAKSNPVPAYGPTAFWWTTYQHETEPEAKPDLEAIRTDLQKRMSDWKDPVIQKLIKEGSIDGAWASYAVDKLPRWSKEAVVLSGDAAHALPSSSGQGVSQAFEDAHALALLLAHYLSQGEPADRRKNITTAIEKYIAIRKPRVDSILDNARRMAGHKRKQTFLEEWLTYGAMWVLTRFTPARMREEQYGHDIVKEVTRVTASTSSK